MSSARAYRRLTTVAAVVGAMSLTGCQGSGSGKASATSSSSTVAVQTGPKAAHQTGKPAPAAKPATEAVLKTAEVGAMNGCGKANTRLVAGKLPASYEPFVGGQDGKEHALVDMAGTGSKQIVWAFSCGQRNAEETAPTWVQLNDGTGKLLGSANLSQFAGTEAVMIDSLTTKANTVEVTYESGGGTKFTTTLSFAGGKLTFGKATQLSKPSSETSAIPPSAYKGAGGARPANATEVTFSSSMATNGARSFVMPSGNIGCDGLPDGEVTCTINSISVHDDPVGGARTVDFKDGEVTLGSRSDAPYFLDTATPKLEYGSVAYMGTVVFASASNGLTVWDTKTGHGAFLNSSGVEGF